MKNLVVLLAAALTLSAAPALAYDDDLDIGDIIEMSREGVSSSVIIAQIESTGSVFYLSNDDILALTDEGVPQGVIEAMIRTSEDDDRGGYDRDDDGYSTGYDDAYRYHDDYRYRYSFALALGYYDPWTYYTPWSAYYASCYPFYRVHYGWYYPFYSYGPWYRTGHHYWYPSYPYYQVNVHTGGRHLWGRSGGSGSGSTKPYYTTDSRSHYGKRQGVTPRSRKPPTVRVPPTRKPPAVTRSKSATPNGTEIRKPAKNSSNRTEVRKPAVSSSSRSRGNGGASSDAGRHYGGRSSEGRRSR
jgi:hypothetical protein